MVLDHKKLKFKYFINDIIIIFDLLKFANIDNNFFKNRNIDNIIRTYNLAFKCSKFTFNKKKY